MCESVEKSLKWVACLVLKAFVINLKHKDFAVRFHFNFSKIYHYRFRFFHFKAIIPTDMLLDFSVTIIQFVIFPYFLETFWDVGDLIDVGLFKNVANGEMGEFFLPDESEWNFLRINFEQFRVFFWSNSHPVILRKK